ncbi:MAG: Rieske (2Fe-2S) protein, partial [Candidatus Sericytochromatia bacterium]
MSLEKVISIEELNKKGKAIFKKGNKQIALFKIDESIFAIDNRCPHE